MNDITGEIVQCNVLENLHWAINRAERTRNRSEIISRWFAQRIKGTELSYGN